MLQIQQFLVFQSHLKETTSPGQSTRRSSSTPLKLSLLRYMPVRITVLPFDFLSSSKPLWANHELFIILLLLISLCLRSHFGYYDRGRTWTQSSQSEPSLLRSHPDKGFLQLDELTGVFYLKTGLSPETKRDLWDMLREDPCCLRTSQPERLLNALVASVSVTYCKSCGSTYWKYCTRFQMLCRLCQIIVNHNKNTVFV